MTHLDSTITFKLFTTTLYFSQQLSLVHMVISGLKVSLWKWQEGRKDFHPFLFFPFFAFTSLVNSNLYLYIFSWNYSVGWVKIWFYVLKKRLQKTFWKMFRKTSLENVSENVFGKRLRKMFQKTSLQNVSENLFGKRFRKHLRKTSLENISENFFGKHLGKTSWENISENIFGKRFRKHLRKTFRKRLQKTFQKTSSKNVSGNVSRKRLQKTS